MRMRDLSAFSLAIVFISAISGVGAIVLGALYNATTDTTARGIITNSKTAISNLNSQLGTIGTITGVMFLLAFVIGTMSSVGGEI